MNLAFVDGIAVTEDQPEDTEEEEEEEEEQEEDGERQEASPITHRQEGASFIMPEQPSLGRNEKRRLLHHPARRSQNPTTSLIQSRPRRGQG